MSDTCGNPSCSVPRRPHDGKLFRAEIEISGGAELRRQMMVCVWLCDGCARQMRPEGAIVGEITKGLIAQSYGVATAMVASTVN